MLSRLLTRRVLPFTQLFHRPAPLDFPINKNDSGAIRNKEMMDQVNSQYSSILSKVTRV